MKITAINGSPKMTGSLSERIIKEMERFLETNIPIHHAGKLVKGLTPPETINTILDADVLLIVSPLYADSLPASLVELFTRLEMAAQRDRKPRVFAVINCGFHESSQTATALAICKHFANKADFPWGYGIGIGGGPPLLNFKSWEKGPASGIYTALSNMSGAALAQKTSADVYVSFGVPRFAYLLSSKLAMWSMARKNGAKNLRAQPYTVQKG